MPPTQSPGPANFTMKPLVGYENHDFSSKKKRSPNYSMGARLKGLRDDPSPGPASYGLENMTRNGKECCKSASMFKKTAELKSDPNPGPTHNAIDTYIYKGRAQPKFTIAQTAKDLKADPGPGPNGEPTPVDIFKVRSPKFTMYGRVKDTSGDNTPAANKYDIADSKAKAMKQNPAYTMYGRVKDLRPDQIPSPMKYDLTTHNPFDRYPAYTIGRRHSEYVYVPILPMDNC